jgi:hypothetical protein
MDFKIRFVDYTVLTFGTTKGTMQPVHASSLYQRIKSSNIGLFVVSYGGYRVFM